MLILALMSTCDMELMTDVEYLLALSEHECDLWVKGLRYLAQDTIAAPYPLQMERWLWKEFGDMNNNSGNSGGVTLKDIKVFLPQVNCKISNQRLKETFQEIDSRKHGELCFDEFTALYHLLVHHENVYPFLC